MMDMERIQWVCRLCGDILDEDDYSEEAALQHLFSKHADLLIELAAGLFYAKRVVAKQHTATAQD